MSNPVRLRVSESGESSINIRHERVLFFDNPWHYHPELELTLIQQSTGLRFVGDSIEPFGPGELVLLGSNLPHYWRNDDHYYGSDAPAPAEALILRFRADCLGKGFLELPESRALQSLFEQATQGILFDSVTATHAVTLLERVLHSQGLTRLRLFLELLGHLSESLTDPANDHRILSGRSFAGSNPRDDSDRISTVLAYIQQHLHEDIALADVAYLANMNATAFCRYFKQQTNKTFVEVLNELRINNACRLLVDSSRDVAEICYESGFHNVPYFTNLFRRVVGQTPSAFRLQKRNRTR